MMSSPLEKNLAALAGETNWRLGNKLFQEGAVLDLRQASRSLTARVASDSGGFCLVKLNIRSGNITSQCSCPRRASICEHAVAALLHVAEDQPELISFLKENPSKTTSLAEELKTIRSPRMTGVGAESLRQLLSSSVSDARLHLSVDGKVANMESHWNRLTLNAKITANGRSYSAGNIKRLVESEYAAGNLRITDFAPRDQQVIRYLVNHSLLSGKQVEANAHQLSDLFHLLVGGGSIDTADGPVFPRRENLNPVIEVDEEKGTDSVGLTPRLALSERGALPPGTPTYIAGSNGYWIGVNNEFWWFPGVIPQSWLLLFLRGTPVLSTIDEFKRLQDLVSSERFPVELKTGKATTLQVARNGACRPHLILDWHNRAISAILSFEYSGQPVPVNGPPSIWNGQGFVMRDLAAEEAASAELTRLGFTAIGDGGDRFAMRSSGDIWNFVNRSIKRMAEEWKLLWTPVFSDRREQSGELTLKVSAGESSSSWFEATCELRSDSGERIPWQMVSDAISRGDDYVMLENGAIVHLPGDVMHIVRLLLRRAESRVGDNLRFGKFAAIALTELIAPRFQKSPASWTELREKLLTPPNANEVPNLSEKLGSCLRNYQREGVQWLRILEQTGFHGILADEMGLGKTIQALAVLVARKRNDESSGRPSLVICPTSLVANWLCEAQRFAPELKPMIIDGAERSAKIASVCKYDLVITSYALLRRDVVEYDAFEFDYIILDEAQHIKNPRTANATACKELNGRHRLVLTGTPVENSLAEIWSIFDFLLPGYLGSHREFRNDYEIPATGDQREQVIQELAAHIHPFILRRSKSQVIQELPQKMEQVIYCDLAAEQRKLYDTILAAGRQMLQQADGSWTVNRFELLSVLMRLRQTCCDPRLLPEDFLEGFETPPTSVKMELTREIILESIDSGHRILLFSQFTSVLKLIVPWLEENKIPYEYLDGATSDRQQRVDRFNEDESIPIFLLSLKAGGTGLNLTGADTVIHYDQWWNPMVEDQATDRTHRIGQTRTVTSLKMVSRNTIEERIMVLQEGKRELFSQLIAGAPGSLGTLSDEDIRFLLSRE